MYKADGKEYSEDSSANQRIKSKFVEREVIYCVSMLMDELFKHDENCEILDECENYFVPVCPECKSSYGFKELDTAYRCNECETIHEEELCLKCSDDDKSYEMLEEAYKCKECGAIFEDIDDFDTEAQEIYEWWIVTDYLANKLIEQKEVVNMDIHCLTIWGRCCTGQSIMLDSVISQICIDMQILEGQKYSWEDKL